MKINFVNSSFPVRNNNFARNIVSFSSDCDWIDNDEHQFNTFKEELNYKKEAKPEILTALAALIKSGFCEIKKPFELKLDLKTSPREFKYIDRPCQGVDKFELILEGDGKTVTCDLDTKQLQKDGQEVGLKIPDKITVKPGGVIEFNTEHTVKKPKAVIIQEEVTESEKVQI